MGSGQRPWSEHYCTSSDFNQDWYYWTSRAMHRITNAGNATEQQGVSWDADIRSGRRLRSGNVLLFSAAASSLNEDNLDLLITMRLLWMIP